MPFINQLFRCFIGTKLTYIKKSDEHTKSHISSFSLIFFPTPVEAHKRRRPDMHIGPLMYNPNY